MVEPSFIQRLSLTPSHLNLPSKRAQTGWAACPQHTNQKKHREAVTTISTFSLRIYRDVLFRLHPAWYVASIWCWGGLPALYSTCLLHEEWARFNKVNTFVFLKQDMNCQMFCLGKNLWHWHSVFACHVNRVLMDNPARMFIPCLSTLLPVTRTNAEVNCINAKVGFESNLIDILLANPA